MKSLSLLLDEFVDYLRSLNYRPLSIRTYRLEIAAFLRWLATRSQTLDPGRLRKDHLYAWQQHLSSRTNQKGLPCCPATLNKRISSVKRFLIYLHENTYIPLPLAKYLKHVKESKHLPTSVLTHQQVRKLIRTVDCTTKEGVMYRCIIELLYSTGIRVSELTTLTTDCVDCQNRVIKVTGKGGKERVIPMGKTALRCLESYLKGIRPFINGNCGSPHVFLNVRGRPYQVFSVERMISRYGQRAGMEVRVTPHTLRRSCTTELIKGNANLYHIKEFLGHESLSTLKPYTKLTILDLKKTHAKCHPRERDERG